MNESPTRPRRHGVLGVVLFAATLAVVLSGCSIWSLSGALPSSGATPSAGSSSGSLTSVHVLRTSAFPQNHIPPLDQTVTDPTKTQRLYDALRALPPFPKGTLFCPADYGEAYHLTFYHGQAQTSWATVKPDGCEAVTLPNGDVRWAVNQDQFWATFADALGVSKTDLFQVPRPSGPSAPTPAPGQP